MTPATRDLVEAQRRFSEFERAGLDGLIAKRLDPADVLASGFEIRGR